MGGGGFRILGLGLRLWGLVLLGVFFFFVGGGVVLCGVDGFGVKGLRSSVAATLQLQFRVQAAMAILSTSDVLLQGFMRSYFMDVKPLNSG